MARLEIIPAIDVRGGHGVRLEQGDYARETVYDVDPARPARRFVEAGATRLHVVDLDGAREGKLVNEGALSAILAAAPGVLVQVGGGVRSLTRVEALLGLGVDRVILGTAALEDPELVRQAAERFPGRIVLGLDARGGKLAVHGWRETADVGVEEVLARFEGLALAAVLFTDIARDGLLQGPNLDETVRLARRTALPVLASGGVSSEDDIVALARTGAIAGVIVGRALYTGAVDLTSALARVAAC